MADRPGGAAIYRDLQPDRRRRHAVQPRASTGSGCAMDAPEVVSMFGILGWIIFGVIVGAIAKFLMPGRDPGGFIVTMLLGIVGALLGGFVGRALGMYGPNDGAGIFMSILGAVIVLFGYRMVVGRRGTV